MLQRLILTSFVSLGVLAGAARADLVGGPDIIVAPASVVDDFPGAENNHQQAFNERQGVVLPVNVFVDGGGFLPAGTTVDSHMIFLNTRGFALADDTQTWTFDGKILGVMSDVGGTLEAASSGLLGASGTTYPGAFAHRGLEGADFYAISPDSRSIRVRMRATEPGDWIRVVTATVPEPASAVLLVLGAAAVIARRRRRRRP